eukprot:scaffold29939_cov148-Skeletonema_menzelii.AAC.3
MLVTCIFIDRADGGGEAKVRGYLDEIVKGNSQGRSSHLWSVMCGRINNYSGALVHKMRMLPVPLLPCFIS